ncbi:MAG: hypothetical protein B6U87_02205 [Candidatus Aenigmarchaeota archaeon ex4484_52]|nr:MAG: hypothetical protein B6U87_02205 [Candidatus Aenigmarchaeota archaeon ex4484_52]
MENKNNKAIIDKVIEINTKSKTYQMNYRKILAMHISPKYLELKILIQTITKRWKRQKKLLKELDNYPIEEYLINIEKKMCENMYN